MDTEKAGAVKASVQAALGALSGVSRVDEVHGGAEAAGKQQPEAGGWPGGPGGGGSPWGGGGNGSWAGASGQPEPERGVVAYRVYAEDAAALVGAAAQAVLMAGADVRDLHVKRPSLEDVFIYLTGRQLR